MSRRKGSRNTLLPKPLRGKVTVGQPDTLVVNHIFWRRAEFLVPFDNLVDSIQEILLRDSLPARTDGVHASFSAHAPDVRTCCKMQ